MAEIFDVMMMAKELGLTHLGNGEVDLTDERVSNLDYLQNVLQQEMDMRQKRQNYLWNILSRSYIETISWHIVMRGTSLHRR